ncbi:MAG TPA: hypothetical protein PLL69_01235, partial [Gemmatimonadales bacterium]|nr:hypothetical protein [Gemmatimonadales bacterium]
GPAWLDARTLDGLEVRTGSAWKTGAVIGGVIGGALFALGASYVRSLCDTRDCVSDYPAVATTLTGIVSFGAIGGFIGWLSPRYERRF